MVEQSAVAIGDEGEGTIEVVFTNQRMHHATLLQEHGAADQPEILACGAEDRLGDEDDQLVAG
ncbi:hypothetical protein D3C78_1936930 [compost metagenome]